ncbi:hypothetical protein [Rubrobacter indicoceani]|uniref:TubC N-terminal docking domain-related protein n=1 Tax=Rubrobacter indicoceani TaxID=2051957 RepID=UPI000E5A3F84|nr:hypothetical protein [Rubrobacter indicoceani]
MSARDMLEKLREQGVCLKVNGLMLRVDAPKDLATEELRRTLRENKRSLIRIIEAERIKLEAAAKRGLVIRYAKERGYIAVHDPATGEWHEVPASGCPAWVIEDAKSRRRRSV